MLPLIEILLRFVVCGSLLRLVRLSRCLRRCCCLGLWAKGGCVGFCTHLQIENQGADHLFNYLGWRPLRCEEEIQLGFLTSLLLLLGCVVTPLPLLLTKHPIETLVYLPRLLQFIDSSFAFHLLNCLLHLMVNPVSL